MTEGKLLITLQYLDKENWVVYTPDGYFDATPNAKEFIGWSVGMQTYPAEKYWDQYYRPGLFAKVIEGKKIE